jgi:pimeloyl-ACP methyl ester carboxylesterase
MSTPRSRRIPLATGLTYHVLEWDAEVDHTVILIHGFLDNAWGWEDTVNAGLGGRFHLIAPDMRGHGDSDRVGAGGYYYFADYLADLHELIAQVARPRLSLVGHSMGGMIAGYYTGSFPDRVHRLALVEGVGPPENPPSPERFRAWLDSWRRLRQKPQKSYATVAEAAARVVEHDPGLAMDVAMRLAERGTLAGADGRLRFKHDPLHTTPGPYGFQLAVAERFWRVIRCPVLLVEGETSPFAYAPEEMARRAGCFANARRVTVTGAAHAIQRHRPDELARLLVEFLGA